VAFRTLRHSAGGFTVNMRGPTPGQIKTKIMTDLRTFGFASVVALSRTAKDIKIEQPKEMQRVFDRPTPFTLRSVFMQDATKAEPYARVWLKDSENDMPQNLPAGAYSGQGREQQFKNQKASGNYRVSKRLRGSGSSGNAASKYLMPQIKGGPRAAKGIEVLMRSRGQIGPNEFLVPGKIKLDRYGNVPPGTWIKILADQGALHDPTSNRLGSVGRPTMPGEKKVRSKYFIATIRGTRAIWERQARGGIVPIIIVVRGPPQYKPRYDFIGVSRRVFRANWSKNLRQAVAEGFAGPKR
jgi:hypothetical protein